MESQNTHIGQRIYDLRMEHDIQQGELAQEINLHQSVLNRIEKGTRPARDDEIRSIALYFGVSADYLLGIPAQTASAPTATTSVGLMLTDPQEIALIKKIRATDQRGQNNIFDTVEREYGYATADAAKREAQA